MTNTELQSYYIGRAETLRGRVVLLRRRNRAFVAGEILSFLSGIAALVAYTTTAWGWLLLVVSALAFAAYVVIRRADVANSERISRAEDLLAVHLREEAGLEGDFSGFDGGAQYVDASHPYTFDMDVFGESSLFQRINRTVTTGGRDYLARCLSGNNGYPGLADVSAIGQREKAVGALAKHIDWCMALLASGVRQKVDTKTITQSLAAAAAVPVASCQLGGQRSGACRGLLSACRALCAGGLVGLHLRSCQCARAVCHSFAWDGVEYLSRHAFSRWPCRRPSAQIILGLLAPGAPNR